MQTNPAVRDTGLDAVIGMYPSVHRARSTVVAPWQAAAMGDRMVRAPRTVLVHGPRGCGVTFIARRLVDELAAVAQAPGVVVESIDADLAAGGLDALTEAIGSPALADVVVVGVSHEPWNLPLDGSDADLFERLVFVPPPDWDARRFRIWETPWGSRLEPADLDRVVVATERWSGADLAVLGENGATVDEIVAAAESTRPSAFDWLDRSRDLVRRFGGHGRLDDLVGYLQRYRML